ncbi:Pleckstrin homology domain-containing protein [Phytophthora infestans]|uniref:PH domain-containing protein n=1 Tax=Phytophthora infestans TaxID=4787 RepID=A0A833W880_PHYIN|nr:Pleckstrin homology domain-containing protein [Phytophthora infestans]KAF4145357.1 PH domain-containing protein [Phytophthora infestans]
MEEEPQEGTRKPARERASSGMLRKELDMRLTAYLPAVVRRHVEKQDMQRPLSMPTTHRTTVVSMFADVSGFTAMTESLAARGPVGAEDLGKHLNSYFEQLLRLVSSAGGDVFKFAGDAMLIFWPESKEDTMDSLLRRALQCALRIQSHLHEAELAQGVVLSVKVGVGIGEATIAHLGGESDGATARVEYVAVGPALEQAFSAEHQAEAGDVICSSECWKRVSEFFDGAAVRGHDNNNEDGNCFHKVTAVNKPVKICSRRPSFTRHDALLHKRMKQYVSRAVWPYLDAHDEFWGSELRDVTVLFINLGFSEQDLARMLGAKELQRLQDAFATVQKCVYDYEGTINKFLVDDKGSTVIAAFGLPPVTHENDPIRGILASLAICAALGNTGLKASVGITTGTALCGVVGHQGNRREYTVLGDIVNLSARLMQRAKSEGGGVITDASTKIYTQDVLHFEKRPEIMVKGKNESIKIHRPYPRMSILMDYHLSSTVQQNPRKLKTCSVGPTDEIIGRVGRANALSVVSRAAPIQNLMENMHRVQVRDAQRRLSVRADRQCLPAAELVESESFVQARTALLDKCSHLNSFAPGGAFVLEGDIGVGKTVLLRSALASPEAGDYQVLVGTASPFATKKPYAVWSELITRGAMEQLHGSSNEPAPPLSPDVGTTTDSTAVQAPSRVAETKRRQCVAQFVRQKIREGAAPNRTLVRYAPLLDEVLDTEFDAYPDTSDVKSDDCNTEQTNQSDEDADKSQRHNEQELRACGYAFAESPDRTLSVKEDEIASWFLGLLEMDLAQKEEEARASMDTSSYIDTKDSEPDEQEDEQESEWRPDALDLSGILLLCALHAMSRDRATVFCLDNAMHMDEKSWVLVTIIAKYFTNCLVVVGTRPPSLALGENTESGSFRKQLRLLKRLKSSSCKALDTCSSGETELLSRQILKVPVIPSDLLAILVSRSQGNPLFLLEIIAEMQEQQVIKVDDKKGARTCELRVQESWGDKSKAQFCFACHASFANPKKDKDKDKKIDVEREMNQITDVDVTRKTKHRCKCCGYFFCAECTPKACQAKIPGKYSEPVRHCRTCYNLSSSRRPSGSSHGVGAAVGAVTDKRLRPKGRIRSIFQSGGGGDLLSSSSASSKSPALSNPQTLTNRIALRPPRTVKSVLTTMLDQLTCSQRMLMKTASAIGPVFDKEMLRGACPIEAYLCRFAQDLEELEQLAMIRRIDTFIGGVPASLGATGAILTSSQTAPPSSYLKIKFEFSHGFMRRVVRDQLLRGQLDKLNARIADFREQQQKELRHKFFAKANESLSRPIPLSIPAPSGEDGDIRRALTPTGVGMGNSQSPGTRRHRLVRRNSHSGIRHDITSSEIVTASSDSSPESSMTQALHETEFDDALSHSATRSNTRQVGSQVGRQATFIRLKADRVVVKKYSSMFSHLKLKGLKNARQWKTRYAVLESNRLLLQYYEDDPIGDVSRSAPLQHDKGARHCTLLSLKGAKVSACDPEVAAKVNCFQVQVTEWTKKGKVIKNQRRSFIVGVESEEEVENWVYMIRFAIESLESQPANLQQ